jgi:hypothetical protein
MPRDEANFWFSVAITVLMRDCTFMTPRRYKYIMTRESKYNLLR